MSRCNKVKSGSKSKAQDSYIIIESASNLYAKHLSPMLQFHAMGDHKNKEKLYREMGYLFGSRI